MNKCQVCGENLNTDGNCYNWDVSHQYKNPEPMPNYGGTWLLEQKIKELEDRIGKLEAIINYNYDRGNLDD